MSNPEAEEPAERGLQNRHQPAEDDSQRVWKSQRCFLEVFKQLFPKNFPVWALKKGAVVLGCHTFVCLPAGPMGFGLEKPP